MTRRVLPTLATAGLLFGVVLVANHTAASTSHTAPAVSVPASYVSTLPHCATEDSPGPCRWFADVDGNGSGRSFWVDASGAVHPLFNGYRS